MQVCAHARALSEFEPPGHSWSMLLQLDAQGCYCTAGMFSFLLVCQALQLLGTFYSLPSEVLFGVSEAVQTVVDSFGVENRSQDRFVLVQH